MRTRLLAILLAVAPLAPAAAQATGDQARLVFSLVGGAFFGRDLWRVPNQPVVDATNPGAPLIDVLDINRELARSWAVSLSATYYRGDHLGFTGDAVIANLKTKDGCQLAFASGSTRNAAICDYVNARERSAMSLGVQGGVTLRAASRRAVSPYIRGTAGLFIANLNTIRTTSAYFNPNGEVVSLDIYPSTRTTRLSPMAGLAAGFTSPLTRAYHFRLETRTNLVGINAVDGATVADGAPPRTRVSYGLQWSILAGIDLVLERKRGRRY